MTSFLRVLFASFYSKDYYRSVANERRETGVLYLFVLIAAALIPVMAHSYLQMSGWLHEKALPIASQFPTMVISNGVASFPDVTNQPFRVYGKDPTRAEVAIDTTGGLTSPQDAGANILVTGSSVIARAESGPNVILLLDKVTGPFIKQGHPLVIDSNSLGNGLAWAVKYMPVLLYMPFLFLMLIYMGAMALACAALGGAFKAAEPKLPFRTLFRITTIALTPVVILNTVFSIAGLMPLGPLGDFILTLGYTMFGIKAATSLAEIKPPDAA